VSPTARALGLPNTLTAEAQRNLQLLVHYVVRPLRQWFGARLQITSAYRSPAVNRAVDGASDSQHLHGEALDLIVQGLTAHQLATHIVRAGLPFDQLIWYAPERGGHVHLSLTQRRANRRQVLHAPASGGYQPVRLWSR